MQTVIIGSGAMGLALAEALSVTGRDVRVIEAGPAVGGLTASGELDLGAGDKARFDRFYHVILTSDQRVRALVERLGLTDRLHFSTTRAELLAGGTIHPASSVIDLATLPTLSMAGRLRVAATIAAGALLPLNVSARRETSSRWLRRWSGHAAHEALWAPLLRAKLGTRAEEASSVFIRSTFKRLAGARLRGGTGDRFGVVEGGWGTILEAWRRRCEEQGVVFHTGARVTSMERTSAERWRLLGEGFPGTEADEVIVTLAGPAAARLVTGHVSSSYADRLHGAPYLGVLCAVLALRSPLTGGYLTYVTDDVPFTGIIEMSNLFKDPAFAGRSIVYLPRYTDPSDPDMDRNPQELASEFTQALIDAHPTLEPSDVVASTMYRARYVMPVPTPDQTEGAPDFSTGIPGLYCVGSAQVTDGTLNVETTLRLAEAVLPVITGKRRPMEPDPMDPSRKESP